MINMLIIATIVKKRFSLIVALIILVASCETDDTEDSSDDINNLTGTWAVSEESQFYKSLLGGYQVEISVYGIGNDRIRIANFYGLGSEYIAESNYQDQLLTLSKQTLQDGHIINTGSGIVSDDFREIKWTYEVDDGSGLVDHATATYTKK
jgi:hypothetical protein